MDKDNLVEVNEITDIYTYLKSIDWKSEYWLFGVGIFHLLTSASVFLATLNIQIVLFSALCK